MKASKPHCYVYMIAFEEVRDCLKIIFVLFVNKNVLSDDLILLRKFLSCFFSIAEGAFPIAVDL